MNEIRKKGGMSGFPDRDATIRDGSVTLHNPPSADKPEGFDVTLPRRPETVALSARDRVMGQAAALAVEYELDGPAAEAVTRLAIYALLLGKSVHNVDTPYYVADTFDPREFKQVWAQLQQNMETGGNDD